MQDQAVQPVRSWAKPDKLEPIQHLANCPARTVSDLKAGTLIPSQARRYAFPARRAFPAVTAETAEAEEARAETAETQPNGQAVKDTTAKAARWYSQMAVLRALIPTAVAVAAALHTVSTATQRAAATHTTARAA